MSQRHAQEVELGVAIVRREKTQVPVGVVNTIYEDDVAATLSLPQARRAVFAMRLGARPVLQLSDGARFDQVHSADSSRYPLLGESPGAARQPE